MGYMEDWEIDQLPEGTNFESGKTVGLFIVNIFVMVMNLFLLFGMALVTLIVWAIGEEEMDTIREHLPSYDQTVLSFAIYQVFTLIPFIISIGFQYLNFYLITLESPDEMKWYLTKKRRGMRILNGLLAFTTFALALIGLLYYGQ